MDFFLSTNKNKKILNYFWKMKSERKLQARNSLNEVFFRDRVFKSVSIIHWIFLINKQEQENSQLLLENQKWKKTTSKEFLKWSFLSRSSFRKCFYNLVFFFINRSKYEYTQLLLENEKWKKTTSKEFLKWSFLSWSSF